jgi:predicted nucleic acid-binding protein
LLEGIPGGADALYTLLQRGIIKLPFSLTSELAETTRLIRRYRDVPISLADACLIRMAELEEDAVVFTTDSDFRIYRRNGRQVIPLVMPE